ncbi:MAG: hypothetical protein JWN04_881 [Myxococcaceae bacterium]|nr:hypothetical protein [Myxococcaceae bacterium]
MTPRLLSLVLSIGFAMGSSMLAAPSAAEAPAGQSAELAASSIAGPRFSLAPGLFVPPEGGRLGLSLVADAHYNLEVGRVIVAPGVRLAGFFRADTTALAALATKRLTLQLGTVDPYVVGGVGIGHLSDPTHLGLAYQAGGGLTICVHRFVALGVEATYFGVTGTDFRALLFGPALLINF